MNAQTLTRQILFDFDSPDTANHFIQVVGKDRALQSHVKFIKSDSLRKSQNRLRKLFRRPNESEANIPIALSVLLVGIIVTLTFSLFAPANMSTTQLLAFTIGALVVTLSGTFVALGMPFFRLSPGKLAEDKRVRVKCAAEAVPHLLAISKGEACTQVRELR